LLIAYNGTRPCCRPSGSQVNSADCCSCTCIPLLHTAAAADGCPYPCCAPRPTLLTLLRHPRCALLCPALLCCAVMQEEVKKACAEIASFPPLVFAGECRTLQERLAKCATGDAFILQGGDCAEAFSQFSANRIRDLFRLILQVGGAGGRGWAVSGRAAGPRHLHQPA